mgnify:CR=1 FL=1
MTVAYLVNHYPTVSHSFIRREIFGLEEAGVSVRRFSFRAAPAELPDPQDRAERERTQVVLGQGAFRLLAATACVAVKRPGRWIKAARIAVAMGQGAPKKVLRHLAYLVEACWLTGQMKDVVHVHAHFGTNSAAVARMVHCLTGLPYSFTVHGPEEFDGPLALDLPGKIADAACVIGISSFGRSQLMRWTDPKAWGKLRVVRCGVDQVFASAAPAAPCAGPDLCCVARLSGQKGLPLLIEAAGLLHRRGVDFRLTLVGDGEMRAEIEQAVRDQGLGEKVRITGYLAASGVREIISASRAMVLPSFAEGLPVAIMEALALRIPVVATQIAGTPELVDKECGWLIPAGSIERLADAMEQVLAADPVRLREMGEVGRQRVLAQHDAGQNARALGQAIGVL